MLRLVATLASAAGLFLAAALAATPDQPIDFASPDALAAWTVTGDVAIDRSPAPGLPAPGAPAAPGVAAASLKVGPRGRATWKLADADRSGTVEFFVYDDGAAAANPKAHGSGALWGLMSHDGHAFVSGSIYAAYLSGDTTYSVGDFEPAKSGSMPSHKVQYLGLPRTAGWHKWTFTMDPEKGLSILVDGKNVNQPAARFDWNKTDLSGIASLVFFGDTTPGGKQVLRISGLKVALGAPMKAQLAPPPPPPPVIPAADPAPQGPPVTFTASAAGKHPRLLLTAERLPQVKALYNAAAGKLYREQMLAYLPKCVIPADRKTSHGWGQEVGLFQMPMVALHHVLTGDKDSLAKSVAYLKWLATTANWTEGGEPAQPDTPDSYAKTLERTRRLPAHDEDNSDTTASFTMVGAALTYDWLYDELDPAFREQFRQALWLHARAMYHGGHRGGNPGGNYWRGVPGYNHRWFRDWGLTLAALAAAEGKPDEQWLLGETSKELAFMCAWLPVDGSQHEGPGYGSSAGALGIAFQASDDCLGTRYLDAPFFRNAAAYTLQVSAPGMGEALYFADCFTVARSFHPFFLATAARARQAEVADGIRHAIQVNRKVFGIADYAWLSLLCDDPTLTGGSYTRLPTTAFLPDLGIAIVRENWQDQAVAAMFKCGPMGGYKANAWRQTAKDPRGALPYLNVAHDQPDANSFILLADGEYFAETDRYPLKPGKLSSGHNTILINGIGQAVAGRSEGDDWQQPGSSDMTQMARIVAWKDGGAVVIAEGEAAGSYLAYTNAKAGKPRPPLDRFRRTFIWVKGSYILVLDDIRSPKPVTVTWLMQGAKLQPLDAAQGRYQLSKGKAQCAFQLVADAPFAAKLGLSTANDHSKPLNWQQLQASVETSAVRFASIYDPWHKNDLKVTLAPAGPDQATVTVTGPGLTDTWQWQAARGKFEPATLHGTRNGGFDVTIDAATVPPPAP